MGNAIHNSGEAKDREMPVNGALLGHMLDRVPETYEVGSYHRSSPIYNKLSTRNQEGARKKSQKEGVGSYCFLCTRKVPLKRLKTLAREAHERSLFSFA